MQSGGQAAGIQLQVGLDLAFFRNQLPKLGAAAAGYTLPINIKFDRRAVQNELNALGLNISQRTYRLEVATNLAAEIELAKKLTTALNNLGRSQQTAKTGVGQRLGVGAIGRAPSQGGLGSKDVEKLYRASARAGLLVFDKEIARTKVSMVAAMDAIGVDAIAGLLNGLSSQDARLRAAAESIGENLIKTTKTSLGIASPSKKFEEIGRNVGKGFEKGALSSMDNAFDAMENKMRQRGKILDTIARGIFGMLGMDPAAMMQQARQQKAVPPRTPIAGLLPEYTSRGAREEIMRQLGAGGGGGGGPSDQGPGKLALSNEALGKRVSAILEEYFRVAEVQVRETFDPRELKRSLNIFAYIAQSLRDAESRTKQARVAESVDSLMKAIDNAIKGARVQVKDLGRTVQPLLPSTRVAGLLSPEPPGRYRAGRTEETQAELFARREREARMRSAQRETRILSERGGVLPGTTFMGDDFTRGGGRDRVTGSGQPRERGGALAFLGGGMGPSSQLGAGYFEVGKGLQAIKQAYAGVKPFLDTKKLPLSGAMAELGGEFGTAIKQVLLYGTAYKALAFFTSLPGQAFEAAKGLATYRNQLQAVTSESKTFDQSLAFVDNLAQRFNVPLDSARQGFVKLYASMQPAGFDQGQIENLFTGISKAAAAFGLSSDKVDRVNYAFAQMASKGQIMSEELKGQLGDVLPGALGLFAQAAQMSIPEFSKAMEDGAFKGKAMEQVLDNVAILMNNKFGPAAQGAAKTLQGAVNQIQNNLTLMYESFGPIVDRFAAIFGPQINSLIKDVTETMKVLTGTFTATGEGFATLSPRAQAFYAAIQSLTPPLQQAGAAIADLGSRFATLLPAMVQAIAAAISFASSPLGRGAIIASVAIGTLTAAIKLLEVTGLKAAIKSVYLFIGSLLQIPKATGLARVGVISLKLAITGLFVGGILIGLDFLIGKLLGIGDAANNSAGDIRGMKKDLDAMAGARDIIGLAAKKQEAENEVTIAQRLLQTYQKIDKINKQGGYGYGGISAQEKEFLKQYGEKTLVQGIDVQPSAGIAAAERKLAAASEKRGAIQKSLNTAGRLELEQEQKTQSQLQKVDLSAGAGAGKPPKQQSLESYYSLQDTLAKNFTQAEIDRLEAEHQRKVDLIKAEYDLKETRANSFQREALKFERRMAEIGLERQGALLKASNDVLAAQGSVAGGAGGAGGGGAGGGGKGLGAGIAQYITGDPSSPFYRSDHGGGNYHEHLAFVSRQAAEEAYKKLTSAGIQVTEFKGKSRVGRHTPGSAHYEGLAFDVPGAQVPVGRERELTARVQSTLGIGGARPAPVPASRKRDIIADQKVQIEQAKQSATARQAEAKAIKDAEIALADFVATATPVEEQKLQNDLLKRKTELMMQGYSDSAVDQAMKFAEAEYKVNFALKLNEELQKKGKRTKEDAEAITKQMTEGLTAYSSALKENSIQLRDNQLAQAMTVLKDRMAMAGAITPDQELREQIRQKNPDFTPEQQEGLFQQEKLVQGAEKLKADMQGIASSIGDAFGTAFKGIITGSMTAQEALAGMFQSIADHFADMVAKMIAEWIKMMVLKGIEAIINPMAGLGNLAGGIGGGLSSGFSAGAASAIPTDAAGWGASFGTSLQFANGGIAPGGFTAFANGGMVTGPTMGLVGEGRYNEAIVPLPDGKSIPVELAGGGSSSPTVIVNVDAKGSQVEGNEQNANQLGRVISAAVQTELIKQQRPGGLLAR